MGVGGGWEVGEQSLDSWGLFLPREGSRSWWLEQGY